MLDGFDEVDDPKVFYKDIKKLMTETLSGCRFVITSREHGLLKDRFPRAYAVNDLVEDAEKKAFMGVYGLTEM